MRQYGMPMRLLGQWDVVVGSMLKWQSLDCKQAFSFLCSLWLFEPSAYAELSLAPKIRVEVIAATSGRDSAKDSSTILITYSSPCKAPFHGLLIQDLEDEYRVGVLLETETTICASMPQSETLELQGFRFKSGKPVSAVKRQPGKGHMTFASVQKLSWPTDPNLRQLTFMDRCSDFLGVVYRQDKGMTSVGALTYEGKDQERDELNCKPELSWTGLDFLPNSARKVMKAIQQQKQSQPLELSLHAVRFEKAGRVQVLADLDCTLVPLGLVLLEERHLALVAAKSRRPATCTARRSVRFSLSQISLPQSLLAASDLKRMAPIAKQRLVLKSPSIAWEGDAMNFRAFAAAEGCETLMGPVFAVDRNLNLTMGILAHQPLRCPTALLKKAASSQPAPVALPQQLSFSERPIPMQIEHEALPEPLL